jgi:hypothetical protein
MMTSFIMLVLEAEGRSNGNITLDPGRNIFAYRHCDDLWTHDGCHVGRFDPCTVRGCGARPSSPDTPIAKAGRSGNASYASDTRAGLRRIALTSTI